MSVESPRRIEIELKAYNLALYKKQGFICNYTTPECIKPYPPNKLLAITGMPLG